MSVPTESKKFLLTHTPREIAKKQTAAWLAYMLRLLPDSLTRNDGADLLGDSSTWPDLYDEKADLKEAAQLRKEWYEECATGEEGEEDTWPTAEEIALAYVLYPALYLRENTNEP